MVARGEISPGAQVSVSISNDGESLAIISRGGGEPEVRQTPTILIADDNHDLLLFLATGLQDEGWEVLTAENAPRARQLFYQRRPAVVLLDYMLNEDDGLKLGLEFQHQAPLTQIILMTGGGFAEPEQAICEEHDFPILYKPFLAQDLLSLIRGRFSKTRTAAAV
jgi:DNA-binding NtrC family response regulator